MKLKLLLFMSLILMANVLFANETRDAENKKKDSNAKVLANQITCTVSATSFCSGDRVTVTFVASGTFNSGNIFTAQLSDAAGSFASPSNIGTLTTTFAGGTIASTIPFNTTSGNGYRIRVTASNLSTTGLDNASNITINPNTPIFSAIAPICSGATKPVLPLTSNNGITGTWSPATVNNAASATYTFTPVMGQCAAVTTLNVTVTPIIFPTFIAIAPICSGSVSPVLPTTSINGITGTWNPSTVSNATSGTYAFTPNAGQCATSAMLQIVVNPNSTPTFTVIEPICSGSVSPVLRTTSNNFITGTWIPSTINNTTSGIYTFTPNAGQCAINFTMIIEVSPSIIPIVDYHPDITVCDHFVLSALVNGNYYTESNGTGTLLLSGNVITSTQKIYIYSHNSCGFAESYFNITVIPIPKPIIATTNDLHEIYIDNTTVVQSLLLDSQLSGSYSLIWYEDGVEIIGATSSTYLVDTFSANGTRNHTVRATNSVVGCSATSLAFAVNQSPVPAPTGNVTQLFTAGQTLANIPVAGTNIQWYSGATNKKVSSIQKVNTFLPMNTLLVNGVTYFASQTINGYESPTRLAVTAQFSLSNNEFYLKDLEYSPNPIVDVLNIKSAEILKNVTVYNLLGQEVYCQKLNNSELKLELSYLVSGNYFIKVESENKQQVFKVIKK